jgi:hypothetical protein
LPWLRPSSSHRQRARATAPTRRRQHLPTPPPSRPRPPAPSATGRLSGWRARGRSTSSSTARATPACASGDPPPRPPASSPSRPRKSPPYSYNGRIFIKVGNKRGYCSGTAINSPTRTLVLTAGHCVNTGNEGGRTTWYRNLLFVPAYTAGKAPFGAFAARRSKIFAPRQWTKGGNPDFDLGAFLTLPNNRGINVADAVGGGAAIAMGLTRKQKFATFGYPGNVKRMQGCNSPYVGDDRLSFPFPGPPTMAIRCHWAPGASGGGWLIAGGTQINGLNSYLHLDDRSRTFGPYFTQETVGKLVAGL